MFKGGAEERGGAAVDLRFFLSPASREDILDLVWGGRGEGGFKYGNCLSHV